MGCGSSKGADAVEEGNEEMDLSSRFILAAQHSAKHIVEGTKKVADATVGAVKDGVDFVADKAVKPVGKMTMQVASLAIALPHTLGQNIKTQAHHLRNVFVAPLNVDDLKGFKLPVYPKSEEERSFITKTITESFIFADLGKRELSSIVDAFEKKEFADGAMILHQGDAVADFFYVVYQGDVVYIVDENEVGSSGAGSSFGELALLYSSPRAATVKAKGTCTTFRVDQKSFRSVLQKKNMQSAEQKLELLRKITFLKDLEIFDLQKLSSAMTPVPFEPNDTLVKKGDVGDAFFMIQEGEVKVTDITVGQSKYEDASLGEGDYFGEKALVTNEPRNATVIAVTKGMAMKIDKQTFDKVLGNLERLILKAEEKRILVCIQARPGQRRNFIVFFLSSFVLATQVSMPTRSQQLCSMFSSSPNRIVM